MVGFFPSPTFWEILIVTILQMRALGLRAVEPCQTPIELKGRVSTVFFVYLKGLWSFSLPCEIQKKFSELAPEQVPSMCKWSVQVVLNTWVSVLSNEWQSVTRLKQNDSQTPQFSIPRQTHFSWFSSFHSHTLMKGGILNSYLIFVNDSIVESDLISLFSVEKSYAHKYVDLPKVIYHSQSN